MEQTRSARHIPDLVRQLCILLDEVEAATVTGSDLDVISDALKRCTSASDRLGRQTRLLRIAILSKEAQIKGHERAVSNRPMDAVAAEHHSRHISELKAALEKLKPELNESLSVRDGILGELRDLEIRIFRLQRAEDVRETREAIRKAKDILVTVEIDFSSEIGIAGADRDLLRAELDAVLTELNNRRGRLDDES